MFLEFGIGYLLLLDLIAPQVERHDGWPRRSQENCHAVVVKVIFT
jgi:hypothetical protein